MNTMGLYGMSWNPGPVTDPSKIDPDWMTYEANAAQISGLRGDYFQLVPPFEVQLVWGGVSCRI